MHVRLNEVVPWLLLRTIALDSLNFICLRLLLHLTLVKALSNTLRLLRCPQGVAPIGTRRVHTIVILHNNRLVLLLVLCTVISSQGIHTCEKRVIQVAVHHLLLALLFLSHLLLGHQIVIVVLTYVGLMVGIGLDHLEGLRGEHVRGRTLLALGIMLFVSWMGLRGELGGS